MSWSLAGYIIAGLVKFYLFLGNYIIFIGFWNYALGWSNYPDGQMGTEHRFSILTRGLLNWRLVLMKDVLRSISRKGTGNLIIFSVLGAILMCFLDFSIFSGLSVMSAFTSWQILSGRTKLLNINLSKYFPKSLLYWLLEFMSYILTSFFSLTHLLKQAEL